MNKIFLLSIFIFSHSLIKAQVLTGAKDSFEIKSFPTYDANGNFYSFTKQYDHLPTKEDSVLFKIEMEETFRPMMDSVEREIEMQDKRHAEMKRLYNEQHKNPKQYASLNPRVGKHLFALHWISWEKFGSANIKKINNKKYSIKGSQKDDKGNYVTIDGYLIPLEKGKMTFIGEIVTKTSDNNNGEACVKKGTYTFLCKPERKYWRLQEMENCEGGSLVDYVDIFF